MRILTLAICLFFALRTEAQLSADQWRADLTTLENTLTQQHPALQGGNMRFHDHLQSLKDRLDGHGDLDVAFNLQAILADLGDSHTRLDLVPMLQKQKPIPLGLGWYDGGLYVSGTTKRFQAILGKKILKINDLDTEEALKRMGRFVAEENEYTIHKDGLQWFRFPAAIRQAGVGTTDTLTLLYEAQPGKKQSLKVFPIDPNNRADMEPAQVAPKDPDIRWQPIQYIFTLQWLEKEQVLYVQYNLCRSREMSLEANDSVSASQLPPFQPFADSIITLMEKHPEAKLFFDLRFNSGGNASDGVDFAQRIAGIPAINNKDRLFVAVNLYTFSSAVQIATAFDQSTNASLIGDQPSQPPNHSGEIRSLVLPNSRLKVTYSTKYMKIMNGKTNALDLDQVILPKFEDFRNGKDPVLDYVRKYKKG